jgi:hypothetical protein
MNKKSQVRLTYYYIYTVVATLLVGIFIGVSINRPRVVRLSPTSSPLPITETSEPSPVPTPVIICPVDIQRCSDGSNTIRSAFLDCQFLSCLSSSDPYAGIATKIFGIIKQNAASSKVEIQHAQHEFFGHVMEAKIYPKTGITLSSLQTAVANDLKQQGYIVEARNDPDTQTIPTVYYKNTNEGLSYHGFTLETHDTFLKLVFWWD